MVCGYGWLTSYPGKRLNDVLASLSLRTIIIILFNECVGGLRWFVFSLLLADLRALVHVLSSRVVRVFVTKKRVD